MSEAKPTQWNETHCEHCGESEGRHYVGRCYSVHSHKFYTPVGDSSLSYRQLVERVKELEEAAKLVLDWYEAENDHSKTDFYQRMQMCRDSEDALRAALSRARPNTAEGEAADA